MCQVFVFLRTHLHFFSHFFFIFMEHFFTTDVIWRVFLARLSKLQFYARSINESINQLMSWHCGCRQKRRSFLQLHLRVVCEPFPFWRSAFEIKICALLFLSVNIANWTEIALSSSPAFLFKGTGILRTNLLVGEAAVIRCSSQHPGGWASPMPSLESFESSSQQFRFTNVVPFA